MEGQSIENMLAGWERIALEILAKGYTGFVRQRKRSRVGPRRPSITRLSSDMEGNIDYIVEAFGGSSDLVIRRLRAGKSGSVPAAIIHPMGSWMGILLPNACHSITALTENLALLKKSSMNSTAD